MRSWLVLAMSIALPGCAPAPRPAPAPSPAPPRATARPAPRSAGHAQRESGRLPAGGDCRADLERIHQRLATVPPPANVPYLAMFGAFAEACARARGGEIEAVSRALRGSPLGRLLSSP